MNKDNLSSPSPGEAGETGSAVPDTQGAGTQSAGTQSATTYSAGASNMTASSPATTDSGAIAGRPLDAPSEGETIPAKPFGPAVAGRVISVDVMRGVAVLGILAMNIYGFAMPFMAYNNPLNYGGTDPLSMGVWFFTHLIFDQKFMPIFSMLFGAGLALMWERADGRKIGGIWYRREFWLLVIGAIHGYLIWFGDILFTYAVMGMLIFPLRRFSPKRLLIIGTALLLMGIPVMVMMGFHVESMIEQSAEIIAKQEAGEELSEEDAALLEQWNDMKPMMAPTPEDITKDIEVYLGSYPEIVKHRAPMTMMMQSAGIFMFGLWRVGGLMLIGMALMKLGIFAAARSDSFYRKMIAVGYGLGLPLVATSAYLLYTHDWDPVFFQQYAGYWNYIGSFLIALGHIGLVMLACRRDWLPSLRSRLEATGRMALTNYLMHSLICTTLFYGYGFGLYGRFDRPVQMLIVFAIWCLQLWLSPIWMSKMRFGPAEWLWRSLTYLKVQRLRKA